MKQRYKMMLDLPIDKKHGAMRGEVFRLIREEKRDTGFRGSSKLLFFMGKDGTEFGAWPHEVQFVGKDV